MLLFIHKSKYCLEYIDNTFVRIDIIIIRFPFDRKQETICKYQYRHESFKVQMLNDVVNKCLKLRIFRLKRMHNGYVKMRNKLSKFKSQSISLRNIIIEYN